MKKRSILTVTAIIAVIGLMGFMLIGNKHKLDAAKQVVDRRGIPIPVIVAKAAIGAAEDTLIVTGVVKADVEADIAANASGRISELRIELGTQVAKGQSIGHVDTRQKEIDLASMELNVSKLEKDYNRMKDLFAGKAASEKDFDDAKYNYESTKAKADLIRQQIADAAVISPVSGTVVRKDREAGEFVNPGTVVAAVVDISHLKVDVMLNERDVYAVQEGDAVVVSSDALPGMHFGGKVAYVSPAGDDSHNYLVQVLVDNTAGRALKAGTFVRARFGVSGGALLQVPKVALAEGTRDPFVYVVNGDHVYVRRLVLGTERGENIAVVDGLKEGELVVLSGQINLSDSSLVSVVNK